MIYCTPLLSKIKIQKSKVKIGAGLKAKKAKHLSGIKLI